MRHRVLKVKTDRANKLWNCNATLSHSYPLDLGLKHRHSGAHIMHSQEIVGPLGVLSLDKSTYTECQILSWLI